MKTRIIWTLCAALVLGLAGCIPSVNPFYTEADLRSDPSLAGRWHMGDNDSWEDWVFTPTENNAYELKINTDKGETGEFVAHLFALKDQLFLDLMPSDIKMDSKQYGLVASAMIPGHLLFRVDMEEKVSMRLTFFDCDWLSNYLKEHPEELAHRSDDNSLIFTADTPALQKFVIAHMQDGELFDLKDGNLFSHKDSEPASTSVKSGEQGN